MTEIHRHPFIPESTERLLDRELREITGDPQATASRAYRAHLHTGPMADLMELRLGGVVLALSLMMVGGVVAVAGGSELVLAGVMTALLASTATVVAVTLRMAGPNEHPSPELEARLTAEGCGDPDRLLSDLVQDYRNRRTDPNRRPDAPAQAPATRRVRAVAEV